jgi:uncharacterized protein
MKFAQDTVNSRYLIESVDPGRVRVGGRDYTSSLLVLPDRVVPDWPPESIGDLSGRVLGALLEHRPEIVILGTGSRQVFPEPRLFVSLMDLGVGYEVMATDAACRTYNILLAEGRRVLAALIVE